MTCGATRLILVTWAVGVLIASITGSDVAGWVAAAVAVAAVLIVNRARSTRFGSSSCAVTPDSSWHSAEARSDPL